MQCIQSAVKRSQEQAKPTNIKVKHTKNNTTHKNEPYKYETALLS